MTRNRAYIALGETGGPTGGDGGGDTKPPTWPPGWSWPPPPYPPGYGEATFLCQTYHTSTYTISLSVDASLTLVVEDYDGYDTYDGTDFSITVNGGGYRALYLVMPAGGYLSEVTSMDISSSEVLEVYMNRMTGLLDLDLSDNNLSEAEVDGVLSTVKGFNSSNGNLDLCINTAPSSTGDSDVATLEGRGWTVCVDGITVDTVVDGIQERLDMLDDNGETGLPTVDASSDFPAVITAICTYFVRLDQATAGNFDGRDVTSGYETPPLFVDLASLENAVGYSVPSKVGDYEGWLAWSYDAIRYCSWYSARISNALGSRRKQVFSSISLADAHTQWALASWTVRSSANIAEGRTYSFTGPSQVQLLRYASIFRAADKGVLFSAVTQIYGQAVGYTPNMNWDAEGQGFPQPQASLSDYTLALVYESAVNNDVSVESPEIGYDDTVPPYSATLWGTLGADGWKLSGFSPVGINLVIHKYDVTGGFTHIF